MSIQRYLVSGESIALQLTDLTVDGEKKYDGYITNRRIIFLKENGFKDILHSQISSLQMRSRLGIGMLILVGALILISFVIIGLLSFLVLLIVILALLARGQGVVIYGRGTQIRVGGSKEKLQRLMFEERNQLSRMQLSPVVSPQPAQAVIQQPIQTSEKVIIKEVVMIPCKYCGALISQTSTYCTYCGAPRR